MANPDQTWARPAEQGFVPTAEWPDVTTMVEGFGSPSLPASEALEAEPLTVAYDDGSAVRYVFSRGRVAAEVMGRAAPRGAGSADYRAVEVRPDIFFVDFVIGEGSMAHDVSMVVDRSTGQVTTADSSFVDRGGAVRMQTTILHGSSDGDAIVPRLRSSELVGQRIYYRYSPTEHYEHVYLNAGTFVWHCVRGGEVGLADADPIQVWTLADGIVILHWSETVMPVESLVVIDLTAQRSIGRMFCWDGPTLAPVHISFDSEFTVLGAIEYPEC